jgi:aflatoxin B1 aldehyde reductase
LATDPPPSILLLSHNYPCRPPAGRGVGTTELIDPVVQNHNLTLIETALRWCVHHSSLKVKDGNDGVLVGVSSLKQLEGNLRDLEKGPLPEEVVQVLDQAWLINKGTALRYWHQAPPKP